MQQDDVQAGVEGDSEQPLGWQGLRRRSLVARSVSRLRVPLPPVFGSITGIKQQSGSYSPARWAQQTYSGRAVDGRQRLALVDPSVGRW